MLLMSGMSMLVSCDFFGNADDSPVTPAMLQKCIVILYENDVHCGIDGYTKMRGLRDAIVSADTSYVAMVSSGDFLQGDLAGALTHGQYVVDIMKMMGYDAVTLGNHEFDYGVPRMQELLPQIGADIVCANLFEVNATTPMYQPYVIKQFGDKRIAFVGITTPESMRDEAYSFYNTDGELLYDLHNYDCISLVQQAADKARQEGADYVVVLSHLGEAKSDTGVDSHTLVKTTRGIDVVLDGHTHSVIKCDPVANLDNVMIPTTQTGTKFNNVGKLWISPEGKFVTTLVAKEDNPYTNDAITAATDSIKKLLEQVTNVKIATTDFDLLAMEGSTWLVRHQETTIGNLLTDAFRTIMDTQIGLVNGGGVRSNIAKGDISYGDVIAVQPNDNNMCILKVTGEELMSMLNKCTDNCPADDGSFPQVSGMKFTIHTGSHTVTDVMIQDKGKDTYSPLDLHTTYTLATNDYCYNRGGMYSMLANCELVSIDAKLSRDMLSSYLWSTLKGVVPDRYKDVEGRITIVND